MGRPPTDPDKKMLGFTVKLTPQQFKFLEEQRAELDVQFGADVVREIVEGLRTWFSLPAYQVHVLQKDMASRKLDWIGYLQELLARRYERIQQEGAKSKTK
jgi:hypothetical protein